MQKTVNSKQNAALQQQNQAGFEKTIQFSQPQAIVWQIKFLLNQITNKKTIVTATHELDNLSKQFGKGFDKYLLRELIEQLDLKDPVKAQMDKNDQFRVQLLNQEISKSALKHEFLQYFGEISQQIFGERVSEFLAELTKRLRLNFPTQLLISISIYESCREEIQAEALKLLKQKLVDYHNYGKPEPLPEYAVHRLMYLMSTNPDLNQDDSMRDIQQYIKDSNPVKPGSHVSLRSALMPNLINSNTSQDDPSISLIKDGVGLDNLDKSYKMLEPWQVLIEIGHYCTYNYPYLLKVLEEFKDMNELRMAKTLLHLSQNHIGTEDQLTRIVYHTFEACKKGDSSGLNKEPNDKKTSMTWSIDNLARAFRELYSNLNWQKVFEALTEVSEKENINLDYKAFQMFLQLFNKCKPQNVSFPLNVVLNHEWNSTLLHLYFIEHSIQNYVEKKDKSINFQKVDRKQELIDELASVKEKVPIEHINVWLSIDLVEKLIVLSDSCHFTKVRQMFDYPIKHIPEYLILTLSQCRPKCGGLMIDELLSLLLPQFLGNHLSSIPVLQHLWKNNQALIIRGICELCRHDQRIMNLSRVLDITQEVRESLMPIVNCDDYYFAVNLGILAGKRDFLHYDQWLVDRIKTIGTPFIKALLKYMKEHILSPMQEFIRAKSPTGNIADVNPDQLENHKAVILDRSHLSREKLCMTIEHLSSLQNKGNPKILDQTLNHIQEFISKISEYYPNQFTNPQNSEEIDNAANDYFQKVFQAEAWQVDQKIQELIETMKKFKESDIKKEQEIYACMLHSLFDEYRFLHRYPQQYLEKIAKLYGAIIKNKIIDGTLQDIALKFAFEAFRREGKRQKFGVITIRQFFDMLPQFPTFFEEIYENRQSVAQTDPQMVKDIEDLYEKSQKKADEMKSQSSLSTQQVEDFKKVSSEFDEPQRGKKNQDDNKKEATDKKKDNKQQNANTSQNEFNAHFQNTTQKGQQEPKNQKGQQQNQMSLEEQKAKTQPSNQELQRTTTPLGSKPAQVFIPSYKQPQKLDVSKSVPITGPTENSNLNIQSVEFKRVTPNQEGIQAQSQLASAASLNTNVPTFTQQPFPTAPNATQLQTGQLNLLNSNAFRPMNVRSPPPPSNQQVNQQIVQMQAQLEQRIQKAINENAKVRLEQLIEDPEIALPKEDIQEQIKFICNNTGKSNFQLKLEELKAAISQDAQINLKWFIHYILTRRISQTGNQFSNLHLLYIEMIKQLNPRESIGIAINQAVDLFKKCLLIDDEKLMQIVQRTQHSAGLIKQYIITLGQFLGGLTVAGNRPIYAKELDLKKLLVESYYSDKLRLVVIFVCRIFKECQKSSVFKPQNPWIKANLEILREIYELQQQNMVNQKEETVMEIESLFKTMQISSIADIKHSGFLKAAITRQFISQSQQVEYTHLINKTSLIPPPPAAIFQPTQQVPLRNQSVSPSPNLFMPQTGLFQGSSQTTNADISMLVQHQQQEIQPRVVVSPEFMQHFTWLGPDCEQKLRVIVGKAVDSSIVEILPPVVDRSVTIALITTRELVLKDFAFDSDFNKILSAADLIVQNLAGSLALVTCREPLKMSLTTNLKKAIQQLIAEQNSDQAEQMNENFISDISSIASRENLELGCKLINKSVVQKALTRVREDLQIRQAIERRKQSQGRPGPYLIDENMAQQFAELPPQLKPNPMGLTDSQFQVYKDFQRQNRSSRRQDTQDSNRPAQISESNVNDIESLLRTLERLPALDEVMKYQLGQKLQVIQQEQDQDEIQKLWLFCQRLLLASCDKFIQTSDIEQISSSLETLSFIVKNFKVEDFQKQLTKIFLEANDVYPKNINLTVILMKNSVISISEWDLNISIHLREYMQFQQPDIFVNFIINFIQSAIIQEKIFNQGQFPNMMSVVEKLSEQQSFSKVLSPIVETLKSKLVWNKDKLKGYILQWAQISFEENNQKQEQEVNKFFHNLSEIGFYKDSEIMYNFCKVMVEISIERALFMQNGTKRPSDRLDYRYIESFLKLMVVLLKTSEINKHEFMSKLFEAIQEVLDEDHKTKKSEFNQKPYYRLLINILTAVNNLQFINPKTHLLILFSLADLFSKLNPNKYPAFSFAWLELISHKQFMPHFLAFQNNQPLQQYMDNLYQSIGPQNQRGQSQTSPQQAADNTFYQKWFKFKELIVNLFTFLKNNMIPGQPLSDPLVKYYEATLRVVLVIRHDFPEFLCDFYFNFVNSLPEHCIQLRNIILSANPKSVPYHNPFSKNLKVDQIKEIYNKPRMLSMSYDSQTHSIYDNQDAGFNDHQVYLNIMNLREDLEKYFRTKSDGLIGTICDKMMQSEEIINGRRKINSNIINAVVLFIGNYTISKASPNFREKECYEMYKKIITSLNNETRSCFLNCLINELRYINSQTYFFSWIVLFLFSDIDEKIQEQITRILIERLQVHEPYPWGLCITFRELLQNPKYNFLKKSFVVQNMEMFEQLFQTRLQPLLPTWQSKKISDQILDPQQQLQLQQQQLNANTNQQ